MSQGLLALLQVVKFKKSTSQRVSTASPWFFCLFVCLFCFKLENEPLKIPELKLPADISHDCGPWEASKNQSLYCVF